MIKTVTPALLLGAALSFTACRPAPQSSPHDAQMEAHLAKIEAHLARIEEALVKQAEANVAQAAQAAQLAAEAAEVAAAVVAEPQEISVYIYGESVQNPGEFVAKEGATLLTVLTATGAYGEFKPRDVTVARPGRDEAVLAKEEQWRTFAVQAGDVITVRASVF